MLLGLYREPKTFTLQGHRGGELITLTQTDGELSGDPDAVEWVENMAKWWEGSVISSPADKTSHDHLSNPSSAGSLIMAAQTLVPKTRVRRQRTMVLVAAADQESPTIFFETLKSACDLLIRDIMQFKFTWLRPSQNSV